MDNTLNNCLASETGIFNVNSSLCDEENNCKVVPNDPERAEYIPYPIDGLFYSKYLLGQSFISSG